MTDIESARTQLLAMAAEPGVTDLTAIVSNIALDLNFGHEAGALIRLLQDGGSFVELLDALMQLRSTLKSVRDQYRAVAGETLTWRDLRIEIMDMDGPRIDKILVAARGGTGQPQQVPLGFARISESQKEPRRLTSL